MMLPDISGKVLSSTGILIAIFLILLVSWLWSAIRSPGPWGVPVFGYYPFLRKDYYRQLHELSKKYGEVYLINIAGVNFVYLDSMRAIREAHINKADCFSFRSKKYGVFQATLADGLLYNDGEQWRVNRKFFVQAMREIGIVPKTADQKGTIEEAIRTTLEALNNKRGEVFEVIPLLTKQCTAVVLRIVLGDDITEEEETKMSEAYAKVLEPMFGLNLILMGNIAKWLLFPRVPGYKQMLKSSQVMKGVLRTIFHRHKSSFNADHPPRDLIDVYLKEKARREKKGDPSVRYLTDQAFVSTLEQVYGDGSVSIALFIAGFYYSISLHLDVQDMVHDEILRVVGTERLPSWEDRLSLPLTYSVILEFMRRYGFAIVFPDMESTKDTTVLGVKVPKGYVTLMNMWAVNNDPRTYENPKKFDPTRFLPEKKAEPPLSFGVGRRACIGETLVMMEVFSFAAATLQNFCILPEIEAGQTVDKTTDIDIAEIMLSNQIRLRFVPRQKSKYAV